MLEGGDHSEDNVSIEQIKAHCAVERSKSKKLLNNHGTCERLAERHMRGARNVGQKGAQWTLWHRCAPQTGLEPHTLRGRDRRIRASRAARAACTRQSSSRSIPAGKRGQQRERYGACYHNMFARECWIRVEPVAERRARALFSVRLRIELVSRGAQSKDMAGMPLSHAQPSGAQWSRKEQVC